MRDRCGLCDLKYEREPGFFYGAMFVSYGISGWLFLIIGFGLAFGLGWSLTATIITVAILTVAIHNQVYRLSRSIWLHFFVKHDPTSVES